MGRSMSRSTPARSEADRGATKSLAERSAARARVTVFAAAAAIAGIVPLPIIPRRMLRQIRGAMAHDVCTQHGLALTAEARNIFAEPAPGGVAPGLGKDAIAFVAARVLARFGPYGAIFSPVRTAFETLALGRLLDRYFDRYRASSARGRLIRIEADEALEIRGVLDQAVLRVIRPGLAGGAEMAGDPPEDYRGTFERTIDSAMITAARLPEWISSRLDAALDDVMASRGPA
jgi:uncharacterized protein (DUF697 family)